MTRHAAAYRPSENVSRFITQSDIRLKLGLSSSHPAGSPEELRQYGFSQAANYWYKIDTMPSAVQLYTDFTLQDSRPWVRVFSSPYNSTATINEVGKNIPWTGFLVQRNDNSFRGHTYFSTPQLFNTRSSLDISTGGNRSGSRIFIGNAGGHGIYNASQQPCNWGDSNNAVGAGWNGSTCGSFPNGLIWGTGQSGTATYANLSGTWEIWITW